MTQGDKTPVIALTGNPNVGKSTLFNALTDLHQHTGNWPGKTVASAVGHFAHCGRTYTLVDLPGTYSLHPMSAEEEVTRDYLRSGAADVTLLVADATCLARNLALALQVMEETWPVVICVNLLDEARKKHIDVDLAKLSELLGCPVVGCTARSGEGLSTLLDTLAQTVDAPPDRPAPSFCSTCGGDEACRTAAAIARGQMLAAACTHTTDEDVHRRDRALDRLLTSKRTGIPVMLLLLGVVLWLTIVGANVPSQLLSRALFSLQEPLRSLLTTFHAPWWLTGVLVDGLYRTVAWVIGVMLPPMAIFFPLFTLLEDGGYLPRVAFNLDHFFQRAGAHGRQSLSMCMALGCNACGVTGCRIIQSRRERLVAILTNSFMPCNGRFPTLIALISMFFAVEGGLLGSVKAAVMLLGCIVFAVLMTLVVSRILTATVLRGEPSAFSLELPPYRMPRVTQVLVRSVLDRTLFTLARAVTVAAPAGVLIWCAGNCTIADSTLLACLADALDGVGRFLGMDGILLLAFFLGFPANEIVIPCALMGYLSAGALTGYSSLPELHTLLTENGWTTVTALCAMLFTLFHFPCGTTCLTILRETKSVKWTALAIALPTAIGALLCLAVRVLFDFM